MKHAFPQLNSKHLAEAATYFISDLHLSDQTPEINLSFYKFLEIVAPKADAIYILGDFLDAWVGDDTPAAFLDTFISACQRAAKHTALYFLRGNRDFLVSDELLAKCQIKRLPDPANINLYDNPITVCHGDHLCGRDIPHLFLRRVSQLAFMRRLFLSFSLSFRMKIAGQLRSESTRRILDEPYIKFDVTKNRVLKQFKRGKSKVLIHGHTHRPRHHKHELKDGQSGSRFVLGCWGRTGTILRHSKQGENLLLKWDPSQFE